MKEIISIPQPLLLLMQWLEGSDRPTFDRDSFIDLFVDALGHSRDRPVGVRAQEFAQGCSEGELLAGVNTYSEREKIWIFNETFNSVVETQTVLARMGYYGVSLINGVMHPDHVEFILDFKGPGFLIINSW